MAQWENATWPGDLSLTPRTFLKVDRKELTPHTYHGTYVCLPSPNNSK